MSERKVLNKYYPPDYDPALIPKLRLAKDRQYVIRVMAPFHMRCKTCGNYIYKGTKFNARKETVQNDDYIGLRIFRFYIKCTKCVAEITFKTDPENMDYSIEHGATRNFEAEKLLEQQEKKLKLQQEEDESNPMKMLEMRTRDSKREMELMENLEELRDLNQRNAKLNFDTMLEKYRETEDEKRKRELDEDEKEIKAIFGSKKVRRLNDDDEENDDQSLQMASSSAIAPSDLLLEQKDEKKQKTVMGGGKIVLKKKIAHLGIVKKQVGKTENMNVTNLKSAEMNTGKTENTKNMNDKEITEPKCSKPIGGLGLVGDYGSSDSSSEE